MEAGRGSDSRVTTLLKGPIIKVSDLKKITCESGRTWDRRITPDMQSLYVMKREILKKRGES